MATQAEIAETTEKGTTVESLTSFLFIASHLYYYLLLIATTTKKLKHNRNLGIGITTVTEEDETESPMKVFVLFCFYSFTQQNIFSLNG